MFDKFGEFDSAEELNKAAAGLKNEGYIASLFELAAENGIDKEDAQDYIDGVVEELTTPLIAALGKIDIECEKLKPKEIIEDWINYIRERCAETDMMAMAVRRKGKSVKGCITELLKWSFKNAYEVDKEICKAAGVTGMCKMGIPGMRIAKKIITEYYISKGEEK